MGRKSRAFSLIEISVVLLVIGLIIGGIVEAGRMVAKASLTSARAQTKNSPVGLVKGLILWLETTTEQSFYPNETKDGASVSLWHDITPVKGDRSDDATQTIPLSRPTYVTKSINSLPALQFDGNSDFLTLPNNSIPDQNSPYTIFIVSKIQAGAGGVIIGTGPSPTNNWFRYEDAAGSFGINGGSGGGTISGIPTAAKAFSIIVATYDGTISSNATNKVFVNGAAIATTVAGGAGVRNALSSPVIIGADTSTSAGYLNGSIAEIIVYDRRLKDVERQEIELYLSKKWKIRLN